MKSIFPLAAASSLVCLCACFVLSAAGEEAPLAYQFKDGSVVTYKVNIVTEVRTMKAVTGSAGVSDMTQTNSQEMTLEETIRRVDMTGNAEIQVAFKTAKMDVKIKSGAEREPQPPDTLKYFASRSVTAYVTTDGKVLAIEAVAPLLASISDTVKDAALMQLIEQSYNEEFFKELIQNLHPQLPLDPAKGAQGWETVTLMRMPRTDYQLRITTKSTLGRVEDGVARVTVKGDVKSERVDVDAPVNPSAPIVEVLASGISGEADVSLEKGQLLSGQSAKDLTMRTTMRIRPSSGRGAEMRSDVQTKTRTTMTVKAVK